MNLSKESYGDICNEPINLSIPMNTYSKKFYMPKIDNFKSKEDLKEHLRSFKHSCYLIVHDDALLLRALSMTLGGQAINWYNSLPQHSLYSFDKLENLFLEHFYINIKKRASITDLMKLS